LILSGCSNPANSDTKTELSEVKAIGAIIPETISLDPTDTPPTNNSPALYAGYIQDIPANDFSINGLGLSFLDYIALPTEALKWMKQDILLWTTLLTDQVLIVDEELISPADLITLGLPTNSSLTLEKAKITFENHKLALLATLELIAGGGAASGGWVLSYQIKMTVSLDGSYELLADIDQSGLTGVDRYWYWIIKNDESTGKTYMLDMSKSDENGGWFELSLRQLNNENRYDFTVANDDAPENDAAGTGVLFLMNRGSGVYLSEYYQTGLDNYEIEDIALYDSSYSFLGKTNSEVTPPTNSFTVNSKNYSLNTGADYYTNNWPADYSSFRNMMNTELSSIITDYFDKAVAGNLFDLADFSDF